jgi:hypothetical protein
MKVAEFFCDSKAGVYPSVKLGIKKNSRRENDVQKI